MDWRKYTIEESFHNVKFHRVKSRYIYIHTINIDPKIVNHVFASSIPWILEQSTILQLKMIPAYNKVTRILVTTNPCEKY